MVLAVCVFSLVEHGLELLRQLADDNLVTEELSSLDDERHVRELFAVQHALEAQLKTLGRRAFHEQFFIGLAEVRAGISVEYVNILQILLAI